MGKGRTFWSSQMVSGQETTTSSEITIENVVEWLYGKEPLDHYEEIDKKMEEERDAKNVSNLSVDRETPSSGLTVLFLSSDTGGGHRASAESLAKQFQLQFPGTTYHLLDILSEHGVAPWNSSVDAYKHFSAHPNQWKAFYSMTNTKAVEMIADVHLKIMCEKAIRERIKSYNPDVVVSVHPLMTGIPIVSCRKISEESGKHLPIFTVVTDLGSAHSFWFSNGVEKMFIASEQIRALAKLRGKVPDEKLEKVGLPIRHDFSVQSQALGDRMSEQGKAYQKKVREDLGVDPDTKTLLIMGGGEGVGSLSNIVDALFVELTKSGIDATILVVCGRNEKLKKDLADRDWNEVVRDFNFTTARSAMSCWSVPSLTPGSVRTGCLDGGVTMNIRKILSNSSLTIENAVAVPLPESDSEEEAPASVPVSLPIESDTAMLSLADSTSVDGSSASVTSNGEVKVVGLGFVTRMAEYMVAADVLVSKAGPGTIAEAASVGLPVMLTSFLPGQEEGNVDFVVDGGFGMYCSDTSPIEIADEVVNWLMDEKKLKALSAAATAKGAPEAAAEIVRQIGESTLKWKKSNERCERITNFFSSPPESDCSST